MRSNDIDNSICFDIFGIGKQRIGFFCLSLALMVGWCTREIITYLFLMSFIVPLGYAVYGFSMLLYETSG